MTTTKSLFVFAIGLLALCLTAGCGADRRARYVVGVSQCSEDVWREKLNTELQLASYAAPQLSLNIRTASDNDSLQVAQIDSFIAQRVDLLIVSPNQTRTISPALARAKRAGIPILLFDRKTDDIDYTAFIGADNVALGRMMGQLLAQQLGGRGRVLEVQGLEGSSPANDRHRGLLEALAQYPAIEVVASPYADWTETEAETVVAGALPSLPPIDAIMAHNDRMAMGARKAFEAAGRPIPPIVGIDALPSKGGGLELVRDSLLLASAIYPTRGDLVLQLALNILERKPFERETRLSTALVNRENATLLLTQSEELQQQAAQSQQLHAQVDTYLAHYQHQRVYLVLVAVICVLLVGFLFWMYRYFAMKHRLIEEASNARLQLFTNLSHDFRTPLTLIADPIDRLIEHEQLPGGAQELLHVARRNVGVMLRLVGEILDLRKVQTGKMEVHPTAFDLAEALRQTMSSFVPAFEKRGLQWTLQLPDALPIVADADKIEQMVYNLLSNALKFTPRGGTIGLRAEMQDGQVEIVVSYTGVGIPRGQLAQVFDQFYQVRQHRSQGTGIGLAIVKAFAELHGGQATVDSAEGKGATFTLRIPNQEGIALEPKTSAPSAESTAPTTAPIEVASETQINQRQGLNRATTPEQDDEKPLLLVVDDNEDVRAYLLELLAPLYDIVTASDGEEALAKAQARVPDLILSDVAMPTMDGLELTRQLKADSITSHIPILLLTAQTLDLQRMEGYESGADGYLTKPFSGKVLQARLQNLLDNRRLLKQIFTQEEAAPAQPTSADEAFLREFRRLIKLHLADPDLSVEAVATQMGLSRVQLYRKVKALTGATAVELIRLTRLRKADKMLREGQHTVAEVSYEVGFSSPSYFSKCFKEQFGRLPGEKS